MKKILLLTVIALFAVSCSNTKKTTSVDSQRVKVEKEECEEMSLEESDYLRGYGVGTSADKMFARDMATAAARNAISQAVAYLNSSLYDNFNQQYMAQNKDSKLTRELMGKTQQMINGVTEEMLKGSKVICSNTYMVGTDYEVHACVELTGIDYAEKVREVIPAQVKEEIDVSREMLKKQKEEALEELRKQKEGI